MQTNADHDDLHYKDYTRALSLLLNWVVIGGDSRAPPSTPTPPAPRKKKKRGFSNHAAASSARACARVRACKTRSIVSTISHFLQRRHLSTCNAPAYNGIQYEWPT